MGNKKLWMTIALAAAILAMALLFQRSRVADAPTVSPKADEVQPAQPETAPPTPNASGDFPDPPAPGPALGQPAVFEDKEFQAWVEKEAKALDLPSVNSKRKAVELGEVVAKLTPEQTRHLRMTALNASAPAGQRVLSAYLLVESGPLGREELVNAIVAPLNEFGPAEAHSEAELRGQQDKSLRIMMIDGLYSRAKNDPSAKDALIRAANNSEDQFVRIYAQRKLEEL